MHIINRLTLPRAGMVFVALMAVTGLVVEFRLSASAPDPASADAITLVG
jgi:hypothetical protein